MNSWLHIQNIDQNSYFTSAFNAVNAAFDIHSLSKMLNRYICLCHYWGIIEYGVKGALASIVLCEDVPLQQDADLRSVNYAMSAPLIAKSNIGIEGRLYFACEAVANPYASKRELVHANLALASSLILCNKLDAAQKLLHEAYITMKDFSMISVYPHYYNIKGLWHGAKSEWQEAVYAFRHAFSEASLLDLYLQEIQIRHNLLVASLKNGEIEYAKQMYLQLLRQYFSRVSVADEQQAKDLLNAILCKSELLLNKKQYEYMQNTLEERIQNKAINFGILLSPQRDVYSSLFDDILLTIFTVQKVYLHDFDVPPHIHEQWERRKTSLPSTYSVNSIPCNVEKDISNLALLV